MHYRFADCELDPELHELRQGGERVDVDPTVFALLSMLVGLRGGVASKRELLSALGKAADAPERSLVHVVSRARTALGDDARVQRIIRTVPRRGYRLAVPVDGIDAAAGPHASGAARDPARNTADGSARRSLAAVVHGDVVGFSRHVAEDEEGMVAWITALRARLDALAREHAGTLVDQTGDSFLVRFGTALDSVRFALALQSEVAARGASEEAGRARRVRLGVHLGDVRLVAERVYGNGVNVAARLQAVAEAGGVCVSAAVYEQVRGRLSLAVRDLGDLALKNLEHPVRAYQLAAATGEAAREATAPTRATSSTGHLWQGAVAVLPFQNLGGDPDQEYFADGIVEDLVTRLAMLRSFPVVARNSTSVYRGAPVDIRRVGHELGARYVVEGSVRRSGDRVRIAAQLIEAETGHHVWADHYDRELGDVFALQDEIVAAICNAIEPEVRRFEPERTTRKPPESFDAWDRANHGLWHLHRRTKDGTAAALVDFDKALELDPLCTNAHMGHAVARMWQLTSGWESGPHLAVEALASARRAVELEPGNALTVLTLGDAMDATGRPQEALELHERAVALNPMLSMARWALGRSQVRQGRYEEAIGEIELAIRMSPRDVMLSSYLSSLAQAQFGAGRYAESVESSRRSVSEREDPIPLCTAAAASSRLERRDDARRYLERARRALPGLSLALVDRWLDDRDIEADFRKRLREGLAGAGLE